MGHSRPPPIFFRWLVAERGLEEIEIKHFIFFSEKKWLSGFFTNLLQARHRLRSDPNSGLRRNQLKLIVVSGGGGGVLRGRANILSLSLSERILRV